MSDDRMSYEEKAAWSRRYVSEELGPFAEKVFRLVEWAALIGLMAFLAKSQDSIVLLIFTAALFFLLMFYLYDVVRGYVPLIVKPEVNGSRTTLRTTVHMLAMLLALSAVFYLAYAVLWALIAFQSGGTGAPQ